MSEIKELWGLREYRSGQELKTDWTKIGIGLVNRDGSITLKFNYLPNEPDIKIQLRTPKEKIEKFEDKFLP